MVPGYVCAFARQLGLVTAPIGGGGQRGHALWLIQRHSARLSLAADAFLADLEKTLRAREAAPDPTRYDEDAAEP